MDNLIPVSLVIGDRTYRIKIEATDEESVRSITKSINEKIIEFKTHFAGKDMQDYISMVLLWYATEKKHQPASQHQQLNELKEKLKKIEELL